MADGCENDPDMRGMTVNERLFVVGLMSEFDEAIARRDRPAIIQILRKAHVDEPSITRVVQQVELAEK